MKGVGIKMKDRDEFKKEAWKEWDRSKEGQNIYTSDHVSFWARKTFLAGFEAASLSDPNASTGALDHAGEQGVSQHPSPVLFDDGKDDIKLNKGLEKDSAEIVEDNFMDLVGKDHWKNFTKEEMKGKYPMKLKPCPFCGSEASELKDESGDYGGFGYSIECQNISCSVNVGWYDTIKEAADFWNNRFDSKEERPE